MNTYHICFIVQGAKTLLCTGKNVVAESYEAALNEFEKLFGKQEILYVKNNNTHLAA